MVGWGLCMNNGENAITPDTYRVARLYWKSGTTRDLLLSQTEIINFTTAIAAYSQLVENQGPDCFTLKYDSDLPTEHQKLSFIVCLGSVAGLELDSQELTIDDLKDVDFNKFRIWGDGEYLKKKTLKKAVKKHRKHRRKIRRRLKSARK